jgi:CP family cyanate transporter-like MFS transporter
MTKTKRSIFALLALIFISLVLRPPVGSIGPLVDELKRVEGLSLFQVGLLTSIPVVCFGLGAFASPALVKRLTLNRAMMWVLVALLIASVLRLVGGFVPLMTFTVIIGLAIAVGNVLIPTIVREQFPDKLALITGVYVTLLAISASLSASIAVPTSDYLGGWRMALAIWLLPTLAAIIFWYPVSKVSKHSEVTTEVTHSEERRAVLRSPLAWAIVAFFGLQSTGFYALLNWLPSLLIDRGYTPVEAGTLLGLCTSIGIPTGFLIAMVIRRFKSLSVLAVVVSAFTLSGLVILWLEPRQAVLACVVTGFGFAATFPLSLTLVGSRASTSTQTTQLSALSQGWGYLIAAVGAFIFGYLKDVTGDWTSSLSVMIALTAIQLVAGAFAGRDQKIAAR